MSRRVAIVVISIAACAGCARGPTPAESLEEATRALRDGDANRALEQARRAAQKCSAESECAWSARLLQAEALLRDGQSDKAAPLLAPPAPHSPQFGEIAARRTWLLGYLDFNRRDMQGAQRQLTEAARLASAANAWDVQFEAQARLAQIRFQSGDREHAVAMFHEVRDSAVKHQRPYYEALALNGLGMIGIKSSHFDEAIPWFERTIAAVRRGGGQRLEVIALQNLAICYSQLGSFDEALNLQQEALNLKGKAAFVPIQMELLGGMGNMYLRDNVPKAIESYRQALAIARSDDDKARWHRILAAAYTSVKDWEQAEKHNSQGLTSQPDDASRSWAEKNAAAIAAGRGDHAEALRLYQRVLADAHGTPDLTWEAHAAMAELYAHSRAYQQADDEYARAIDIIDHSADSLNKPEYKLAFFANLISFHRAYVETLVGQQSFERALEAADSSRARILAQNLALAGTPGKASSRDYPAISRRTQSVLLFYWIAPAKSYLWVVTANGVQRPIELPPAGQIRRWVEQYRAFIEDRLGDPLTTPSEAGRELYRGLIAPAARWIPPGSRVVLFPDDALNWLNFETLPVDGGSQSPAPHYWIEDVRLTIAPSLSVMRAEPAQAARTRSLLIIGDPLSPNPEFAKLDYAAREIETIKAKFPAGDTKEFTGSLARPTAYLESSPHQFSLLHFSTHAVANKQSPLDSAIILSPEGDNFKLYARDIIHIPLDADLVTISACRSAGARSYSGEGMVGFAWAFLQAGAHNVIAGLWDITDSSTPGIMDVLYSQLAAGKPPRDALREAKLHLIHSASGYRKPYYWGPFQLYSR